MATYTNFVILTPIDDGPDNWNVFNAPTPKYVRIDEGVTNDYDVFIPDILDDGILIDLIGDYSSGSQTFELGDMPDDFVSAISVIMRIRGKNFVSGPYLYVQIVASDGVTPLCGASGNIFSVFGTPMATKLWGTDAIGDKSKTTWNGALFKFFGSGFNPDAGVQAQIEAIDVILTYVEQQTIVPEGGSICGGSATVEPFIGEGGAFVDGSSTVGGTSSVVFSGGVVGSGLAKEFIHNAIGKQGIVVGGEIVNNNFTYIGRSEGNYLLTDHSGPYKATYRYNPDLNLSSKTVILNLDGDGLSSSALFDVASPKWNPVSNVSVTIPLQGVGSGTQSFIFEDMPLDFVAANRISLRMMASDLNHGSPVMSAQFFESNESTALTSVSPNLFSIFGSGLQLVDLTIIGKNTRETWDGLTVKFVMSDFTSPPAHMSLTSVSALLNYLDIEPEGIVQISGDGAVVAQHYTYAGRGNFVLDGSASTFNSVGAEIDGTGMSIEGEATVHIEEYFDQRILWQTRTEIFADRSFRWNTGNLRTSTFRIVTKCRPNEKCEPFTEDPGCDRFTLITLTAKSVAEVCRKLTNQRLSFPIADFSKFSVPPETADLEEDLANGIANDCIELIPVDFCEVPECLKFCVDYNETELIELEAFVAINAFLVLPIDTSVGIVVSGTAGNIGDVIYRPSINIYIDVGSNECAIAGGESYVESTQNFYISDGQGAILGGDISGSVISSNWNYESIAYPINELALCRGSSTPLSSDDLSIWRESNRITSNDGLWAYAHLPPEKPISENLIANNFGFNLPEGSVVEGVVVILERKASPTTLPSVYNTGDYIPVVDREIKLVVNDIESEAKAFPNYWPFVDFPISSPSNPTGPNVLSTYVLYGGDDDSWNISLGYEEINDSSFGVSIAVENLSSSVLMALIDTVAIEIYYSNVEQGRIIVDGSAIQKASHYSMEANSGVLIGEAGVEGTHVNYSVISDGSIDLSGNYGLNYQIEVSGETEIGGTVVGDVVSSAWIIGSEGGIEINGEINGDVISSAWTGYAEGGMFITDINGARWDLYFTGIGGMTLGGYYLVHIDESVSGGITIEGEVETPIFSDVILQVSGGITIDGDSDIFYGDFSPQQLYEVVTEVKDLAVIFSKENLTTTPLPSATVNACGCLALPLSIDLQHNISRQNKLSSFITRNWLTFPRNFPIQYSTVSDSWKSNFHFSGYAQNGVDRESWSLLFELACTNFVGGTNLGRNFIKFSMTVRKKNLNTGEDFDTKLLVSFDPSTICRRDRDLVFSLSMNAIFKTATISPEASIQDSILYDNIGLFKTKFWNENSDVIFNISEVGTSRGITRVDLAPSLEESNLI